MATAPAAAVTLPGRNTAAHRYCSASSLKLTKPITGQVAPGVVMSVEKRQLLRAVRGIVGRVQIDGDAIGAMAQPLGVTPEHALGQELAHAIAFFYPNSVLETRQRRLRSQGATLDRIAIHKQFVNWILRQAG